MKIHASYVILWALGYIYTSAEGITAAHVDSWNMNSSWPQNCPGFWLNFSQVFCSCPCCHTLSKHFYMKCTMGTLPRSCSAVWVLIPMVTELWDVLAKFRNSNVLWYCHPKSICHSLATGAFGCHCWFCPNMRVFPRKSCNSLRGKWATLLQGFYSAVVLAQSDLCRVITY